MDDELHRRGSSVLEVFYTQESIRGRFHDGSRVREENIKEGWTMRVTQHPTTGQWFTLNNRLLFAYRRAALWPDGNCKQHHMIDICLGPGKVENVPFDDCKDEFL